MSNISGNISQIKGLTNAKPQVLQAIQQASAKSGVDFAYLVQKAGMESSFNPSAQAKTSSASGLYQFVKSTWLEMVDKHGAEHGLGKEAAAITRDANGKPVVNDAATRDKILALRNDPTYAAAMAAEYAADNKDALQARLKNSNTKIGSTEMYLAHFLGTDGAGDMLETMKARPDAPAAAILPKAAAANHTIFYTDGGRARTVSEVYNNFAAKFNESTTTSIAAAPQTTTAPVQNKMVASVGDLSALPATPVSTAAAVETSNESLTQLASNDIWQQIQKALMPDWTVQLLDLGGHLSPDQDQRQAPASPLFG